MTRDEAFGSFLKGEVIIRPGWKKPIQFCDEKIYLFDSELNDFITQNMDAKDFVKLWKHNDGYEIFKSVAKKQRTYYTNWPFDSL